MRTAGCGTSAALLGLLLGLGACGGPGLCDGVAGACLIVALSGPSLPISTVNLTLTGQPVGGRTTANWLAPQGLPAYTPLSLGLPIPVQSAGPITVAALASQMGKLTATGSAEAQVAPNARSSVAIVLSPVMVGGWGQIQDVLVASSCAALGACHGAGTPAAPNRLKLDLSAGREMSNYFSITAAANMLIDKSNPAGSRLVTYPFAAMHTGGMASGWRTVTDTSSSKVVAWIKDGAPF